MSALDTKHVPGNGTLTRDKAAQDIKISNAEWQLGNEFL